MSPISYRRALFSSILILIVTPLLLLSSVMLAKFYNNTLEQAANTIEWHARNNASAVEQFLYQWRQSAIAFSRTKAVSQLPVNIIFSQFALTQLQQYVQENSAVSAALVVDTDGYVVEGYPVSTLNITPDQLKAIVNRTLSKKDVAADVFIFNDAETARLLGIDSKPYEGYFAIVTPLIQELDSLSTPFRVTGASLILIPFSAAMEWITQRKDYKPQSTLSRYRLLLEDNVVYETRELPPGTSLSRQAHILDSYFEGRTVPLYFVVSENKKAHLAAVNQSIILALILVVILVLVCIVLARWMTQKLNKPLTKIAAMSQAFSAGRYQSRRDDFYFSEFKDIAASLNAMAQTIESQITSLEQEKEKAQASERLKGRFLANVSHEIRTPMNGIFGFLQLLRDTRLDTEQNDYVRQIRTCGEMLLTVINDVLDFSKIEANKVELDFQHTDIKELLRDVIALFKTTCEDKGVNLLLDISEPLPTSVHCDPVRLKQILVNLLSNAVKFTQRGEVSLSVSYGAPEGGQKTWYFSIKDSGIGIPQQKLAILFQPFVQAEGSTTREFGGTGLGLSICKGLAELMDGRIEVSSTPGQGSCFTVVLPLALSEKLVLPGGGKSLDQDVDFSGHEILVVEDNPVNQLVLGKFLERLGLSYELAHNGLQACEMIEKRDYDLVLMDIQMPVMDGLTASKKMLERGGFNTPIIAVSANAMVHDIEGAKAIGMSDHLAKPIELEKLKAILAKWLLSVRNDCRPFSG